MAFCRSLFLSGDCAVLQRSVAVTLSSGRPTRKIAFWKSSPTASSFRVCALHKEAKLGTKLSINDEPSTERWKIKMLYDGDCPLCLREVNFLRKRNEKYGAIKFVDIASKDYTAEDNQGLDYKTAMGRIHAILYDGTVIRDVEAFRRLYEEVGLGWVYAVTKYEPVATIAGAVYDFWAKYRLPITGRPSIDEVMSLRKKSDKFCDGGGNCKM